MHRLVSRVSRPVFEDPVIGSANDNIEGESGTSSKGSEKSSGSNGKQGAMSKMKEGLKKVAHPRHGKQSSE